MNDLITRALVTTAAGGLLVVTAALPAAAHPHNAKHAHQGSGQELANGQNHGPYTDSDGDGTVDTSCGGEPAAYGLESAHHGPDSGTPGKGDGCYQADGAPGRDTPNPAIR